MSDTTDAPATSEITVVAEFVAKEGQEKKLFRALERAVEPTRLEDGCRMYRLHRSLTDPGRFVFYERWASEEALDAHGETEHIQQLGEAVEDIVERRDVERYEQVAPEASSEEADPLDLDAPGEDMQGVVPGTSA